MKKISWASKRVNYILMAVLVIAWGFEYIAAKSALDNVLPITLVFFKYSVAVVMLLVIKLVRDRRISFRRRDIPFFFVCAIFGNVLYYVGEYGAMNYMPISLVTIVLAFVPIISILLEFFIYKIRPTVAIVAGIVVGIVGVVLVVGADVSVLTGGRLIGYLLAFMAVGSWNVYNFITARLTGNYAPLDLTIYQLTAAILVSMPYALFNLPDASAVDAGFVGSVLYIAIASSALGFVIYINALHSIGVTPTALFSNMLPVSSAFFGWFFLGELIAPLQIVGGVIVVAAGSMVIWKKGKDTGRIHTERET
ncbi:MAG: DMT family transporter [Clostridiales Family XIII bacterium]|jgi:drug/metabolite transporter (DMT)-like permease|nr:DMT family transporter [Clostridiales Family XIII bacterium]